MALRCLWLLTFLTFGLAPLDGQEFNSPEQILQIIQDSKLSYELRMAPDDSLRALQHRDKLVAPGALRDERQILTSYRSVMKADSTADSLRQEAERAFAKGDLGMARDRYLKLLERWPVNSQILTALAKLYTAEGKQDQAYLLLRKATAANPIDFEAQRYLARNLQQSGKADKALEHIALAHLLNRNDADIFRDLQAILAANKREYDAWDFVPIYSIEDAADHRRNVLIGRRQGLHWMMYAMCKACWAYEPGYKEQQSRDSDELPIMLEEKECLANLAMSYKRRRARQQEAFPLQGIEVLSQAIADLHVDTFALYELILPRDPEFAMQLSKPTMKRLVAYLLRFRSYERNEETMGR